MSYQQTVLHGHHQRLGARMMEFGGWEMPLQYAGILAEHEATRTAAGLFDTCHMGEFIIEGPGAAAFLDRVITRRLADMQPGECRYGLICDKQGGILDDCITYRYGAERFMVVVNAGTCAGDLAHLQAHLPAAGVRLTDISEATGKLDLQGPKAREILQPLTDVDLSALAYFHFREGTVKVAGANINVTVSRTGYTGEPGYELYLPAERTPDVWDALLAIGNGLMPAGLGARDTLRLEACLLLHGSDISRQTNPFETGLRWCVDVDKLDLIGGDALRKLKEAGPARRLVAFRMQERVPARRGYAVYAADSERRLGDVSSGGFGPTVQASIGLALIAAAANGAGSGIGIGTELDVVVRGKRRRARIVKKPFYRNDATKA